MQPLGDDPVADYRAAADDVLAAFAEKGVLEREFALPELGEMKFPAPVAIGFHLIDYVAHGWDVAKSLGLNYELDPDLAEVALKIALKVPVGESGLGPEAAFGPVLPVAPGAGPLEQILGALGRSSNTEGALPL